MIILDFGIGYDLCGLLCQEKERKKKRKIYKYFEMSFSCFRPFGVWGVILVLPKIYRYFEMYFSCFRPFGVWGVTLVLPTSETFELMKET